MKTLTINIANNTLVEKFVCLLEHFRNDSLKIVSKEDIKNLCFYSLLISKQNLEKS